jgi:hypothetical protein
MAASDPGNRQRDGEHQPGSRPDICNITSANGSDDEVLRRMPSFTAGAAA